MPEWSLPSSSKLQSIGETCFSVRRWKHEDLVPQKKRSHHALHVWTSVTKKRAGIIDGQIPQVARAGAPLQ
jgi:hypothetical protein